MKEALHWKSVGGNKVKCGLCAHNCGISEGKRGICGVRLNKEGTLYTLIYSRPSSAAVDPIEKKPLYNFHPTTDVFSYGTLGCTFKCSFCQNWSISQTHPEEDGTFKKLFRREMELTPQQAVRQAIDSGSKGIAWTYNEPTIWHEFSLETSRLAKKKGLYTVYVSNGYINPEPLKELAPFLDAMNVDVKAFTEDFYKSMCKAKLQPVLNTCKLAKELGIHVETTTLLIPGKNDSKKELKALCKWVHNDLGKDTPVHFSRYHPDYKYEESPKTPEKTMVTAYKIAKKAGLDFVYIGNMFHPDYMNTFCPKCNTKVINRASMFTTKNKLKQGKCPKCSYQVLKHY